MPRKDPEARREYSRQYAAEHREEARQRASEWYYAHRDDPKFKEEKLVRNKKWKEEHREEWLAYRRQRWAEKKSDPAFLAQRRAQQARYRAKKFPPYTEAILEAKKAGCCVCGETDHIVLDFHHVDPTTKKYRVATSRLIPTLEDLAAEIAKCVVLCVKCHRRFHAGVLDLPAHITDYRPTRRKNGRFV